MKIDSALTMFARIHQSSFFRKLCINGLMAASRRRNFEPAPQAFLLLAHTHTLLMAKRPRFGGAPPAVLNEPCLDLVLGLLGPASSVSMRSTCTAALRAWHRALVCWMRCQLGPSGWLATDLDRWWRQAPSTCSSGERQSADLRRILAEVIEARIIAPMEANPRLLRQQRPAAALPMTNFLTPGSSSLACQYRSLLQGMDWLSLWQKAWQVLCWMPAMWSHISYMLEGTRTLDERIYALKTEKKVYSYTSSNPWDDLCRDVLPMEPDFPRSHYMRIIPQQPHMPARSAKLRKFRAGVNAFTSTYSVKPTQRLLSLYRTIALNLAPFRSNIRSHSCRFHLDRGNKVDVLQIYSGQRETAVATLTVRHRPYLKKPPVVRKARLLLVQPKKLSQIEKLGDALWSNADECVWCGRSTFCSDRTSCHQLHMG